MSATVSPKPSWLKTGAEAHAAHTAHAARQEAAKEAANKMRRFYLDVGGEKIVTFLDGVLGDDGVLDAVGFNEHTVQVNGKWDNFHCVAESELCPICSMGSKPDYVRALTVLVHTPYTIKNGPNAGKVLSNFRQLYVAKFNTFKKLQTLAGKRGGLRGWRIEISRTGDKDPRVGDSFQFLDQHSIEDLQEKFKAEAEPADYAKELIYLTGSELLQMGVGKAPVGIGLSAKGGIVSDKDIAESM